MTRINSGRTKPGRRAPIDLPFAPPDVGLLLGARAAERARSALARSRASIYARTSYGGVALAVASDDSERAAAAASQGAIAARFVPSYLSILSVKVPLRARRGDIAIIVILVAFLFTTFVFDVTSVMGTDLVNSDRTLAASPSWPPRIILSGLIRYGEECDHLFLHNPLYFRAMMWGDIFFLGPFYALALYAFVRGCNWIRVPTFLYGSHVLSYALILGAEQLNGLYASPRPAVLFAFYAPYWIFAVALMIRVRRNEPFTATR